MSIHDESVTLTASIAAHEAEDARLRALYVVDLSDRDATIADLHAQNLALQARVASLEAVTPQPPVVTPPVPAEPPTAPAVGTFAGPSGKHYPPRTPKRGQAPQVEVDCTWAAIAKAANEQPDGTVVLVRPGSLVGNGAGATKKPVISGVGKLGRTQRILITPRDGADSIKFTGDSPRLDSIKGVTFLGFNPQAWGQNGLEGFGVVITGATQDFAWSYSKTKFFNWTASGAAAQIRDVQFVEVVSPSPQVYDNDRSAWRIADGGSIQEVDVVGCYYASSFNSIPIPGQPAAHTDTLQFSGAGLFKGIRFTDTVLAGSTNAVLITTSPVASGGGTYDVTLENVVLIGGKDVLLRSPQPPTAEAVNAPIALNSQPANLRVRNSLITGPVKSAIVEATNSFGTDTKASGLKPIVVDKALLDARAPIPTDERLRALWA